MKSSSKRRVSKVFGCRWTDGRETSRANMSISGSRPRTLRGPIGGYFVWTIAIGGPLCVVAGGSGVAPLMAMLRHRDRRNSRIPAVLLYSSRNLEDVIYRKELGRALPQISSRLSGLSPHCSIGVSWWARWVADRSSGGLARGSILEARRIRLYRRRLSHRLRIGISPSNLFVRLIGPRSFARRRRVISFGANDRASRCALRGAFCKVWRESQCRQRLLSAPSSSLLPRVHRPFGSCACRSP